MTQAQLQNSSVLAEIAFNAFTQELELTMQAFTSRNALLDAQAGARAQVESNYLAGVQQLQENQSGHMYNPFQTVFLPITQ